MKHVISAMVFCAGGLLPSLLVAQDDTPQMPESCAKTASTSIIQIVVCTEQSLSSEAFIEAGRAACEDALPCGAWIWTDAGKAPATAPENHDGLTQDQVTSARGVWVAEQENFIVIDVVEN